MAHLLLQSARMLVLFRKHLLLFLAFVPALIALPAMGAPAVGRKIQQIIQAAGNTSNELERLGHLRQLSQRADLPASLRADLEKLLPVVDDWADGKKRATPDPSRAAENGYLCRFFVGKVRLGDKTPVFPPQIAEDSPLYPIWCLYRGRMLIWQVIQSGPLLRVKESREAYFGEARRLLMVARNAYPANKVARMYLGEPIPWPKTYPAHPAAPAWANAQREGFEKLADVIHWWIAERQIASGEFGGGWGDDVEMWRWWVPILIGFEDPVVNAAQERISSGIFQQPHMKAGFTSRVTDVEHSNEDTTDTIQPMMHIKPDDVVWKKRALRLTDLMRERWTGTNARGQLQFKSIYFSVDKVDESPARAFDTVYHPSIIQPALIYWQRTGDPELGRLISTWLNVWVDAAARAESGKPAGVLPSVIQWPSGVVGAPGKPWWEPFPASHNDALYNWPGATRLMTSTLLLAAHQTGDARYLEPIKSMAAIRLKHQNTPREAAIQMGGEAWAARQMGGFLGDALAKYRCLTGDKQFDSLLASDASGYMNYRLTGDSKALVRALERNAEAFRSNWEAYTAEMRWTDRVMSFTRNFLQYLPESAPPAPSPEILYSSVTGDPGNPLIFPLNAVRWLTLPREFAALVKEAGTNSFSAQLFHFTGKDREMGAEFYLLKPGRYTLAIHSADAPAKRWLEKDFEVSSPLTRVAFAVPGNRLCQLSVTAR